MKKDFIEIRKQILTHFKKEGRHALPWRISYDPYHILVSEVMLQQTQVDRVVPKYKQFLKKYSTVTKLARAPLGDVLRAWQGLGYNRRAKHLHEAARGVLQLYGGKIPKEKGKLTALPGIGLYTAGAIRAFAFDEPDDLLETNIRTVLIHEFFPKKKKVSDSELMKILPELRGKTSPRFFYSAMMDYGASLKREGVKLNQKSKHYTKQKPFKGSDREVRGAVLRAYSQRMSLVSLSFPQERIKEATLQLLKEGLIVKKGKTISLPN